MLYTAAFAGRPNGALLSHTAITTQDMVIGMLQEITGAYVYLNSGPLFHIATFMTTLATFHFGGTNVFTRRVDAEELCRIIAVERCTGAFLLPPTIDQIVAVNRDGKYDLKSLRTYPGKPEWTEMITVDTSAWARHPGGYGQTEVMGMLTLNSWGGRVEGTHGRSSPMVQLRIVDPDGNEVPTGETGEIVARGPTVMTGYWNRVGKRPRRVVDERRELGLHIGSRIVRAQFVDLLRAALMQHCRAHIASYKKPRSVEFVDALPRDGWMVDYDALDARFGGGGYPGGRNRSA